MHRNPFESLDVPALVSSSTELRDRWVIPLYMKLHSSVVGAEELIADVTELWPEMTEDLACGLLSIYNWRPRIVGAYVAAFKECRALTGLIGRLLLRSDVCYAGRGYCVALSRFNTPESTGFLLEYLDYYLTRIDLWFDQGYAMGAIAYLDAQNGTNHLRTMMKKWEMFVADKPYWDLKRSIVAFDRLMTRCDAVSARQAHAHHAESHR